MAPTPIFILSLPRAGSTLLQRILAAHPLIETASEPWFLLPPLSALHEHGVRAEYDHVTLTKGVRGFAQHYLPNGMSDYRAAVRELALTLYEKAAPEATFFVDKTPRYGQVSSELFEVFPDGKFVFLWRNPLAIAASMVETYGGGAWNIKGPFAADLSRGLPSLIATWQRHEARAHAVVYENLVSSPEREVARVLDYLGLDPDPTLHERFADVPMRNVDFWDPTGSRAYRRVSMEPLEKWHATMATAYRKRWCRRYLDELGDERLELMGYDPAGLRAEVERLPERRDHLVGDLAQAAKAPLRRRLGLY